MTMAPNRWHCPRMRKRQNFTSLKPPQQHAGLDPRVLRERRSLDLGIQPDQGFIGSLGHAGSVYVISDMGNKTWGPRLTAQASLEAVRIALLLLAASHHGCICPFCRRGTKKLHDESGDDLQVQWRLPLLFSTSNSRVRRRPST